MAKLRRMTVLAGLFALLSALIRILTPERHSTSGPIVRRRTGRKTALGVFTVAATILASSGVAFANAANPLPDSHGTADVANGTVTTNQDGSIHVDSGTVTVQVGGTWNWGTLSGSSEQNGCDNRYGVGWAVDWSGISTAQTVPGQTGSWPIKAAKGTPQRYFHVFNTNMLLEPSGPPNGDTFPFPLDGQCDPVDADGFPQGPWKAVHTYPTGSTIPAFLCVNMYDLHGKPGDLSPLSDINPAVAGDNSVKTNDFDPTVNGQYCFTPKIINGTKIVTTATATAKIGSPISDSATLSGASANAGGTIVFKAYNNDTCTGTPAFTSPAFPVNGNGTYGPATFTPNAVGTYNWIAAYSGDDNNSPATGACQDEGETSTITQAGPSISTTATPQVELGASISDSATLSGASANATGNIVFKAWNNETCTGTPAFQSSAFPVNGNGTYGPATFTPNAVGTYNWIAAYSGDANNSAVSGACKDTGETSTVNRTPVQTLAAHIYDCSTGASTTEVPGGKVSAAGPTSIAQQINPLNATQVISGAYVVSAVSPAGYHFVDCGSGATLIGNPPLNATQGAQVDPDENEVVIFYVFPNNATPAISTTATATAAIGSPISDSATLSGATANAGGTIVFKAWKNNTCTGTPAFVSSAFPVSGNGTYGPATFTPASSGTYNWIAAYSGDLHNDPVSGACQDDGETSTVTNAGPAISTTATETAAIGSSISDTATLTGASANAGGTIVFKAWANETCTGAPAFQSSAFPVNGNGTYGPATFTPATAGTYNWIAAYSGDANNDAVSGACKDLGETTTVTKLGPAISTSATPQAVIGSSISDSATLSGASTNPPAGGSIVFKAYANETCTGTPAFTSPGVAVNGNGTYGPVSFVPTTAGNYNWVAAYSGDANNNAVSGACKDEGETSTVTKLGPAISTSATEHVELGAPISDSATLTGATTTPLAGGNIVFTAYNNDTCTGTPTFTSQQFPVAGNGIYGPATFTPAAVGTYYWIATYSGDVNNAGVAGACQDEGEISTVTKTPVQTLAAHIYDCSEGASTDEVEGGTLSAAGPTSILEQANPLDATQVATGAYVVSAGAPDGYHFVDCGSGATLLGNPPLNATQGAQVDSGEDEVVNFYVVPNEAVLSIAVAKTNDANHDGTFTDDETGRTGDDVNFRAKITNHSDVAVVIVSLTDEWPGTAAFSPECEAAVVGQTLAANGGNVTCDFTVADYVPTKAEGAKVNTVTVNAHEDGNVEHGTFDDDTSTVRGDIPPLNVTVAKTNDANGNGTYTDDETGRTGDDVNFRAKITNNSSVDVVITSIVDSWFQGGAPVALQPDCEAAVIGQTLAANGGNVTCDFTVADYVPTAQEGAKINTVTVEVCEAGRDDNCDTPDDDSTVHGQIPPLNVTVDKTNDANNDGTFTDDETGRTGDDVNFRAKITNNSAVAVVIKSLSDVWPGQAAFSPECEAAVVGQTLAANGGSVTCDFTVADYVPSAEDGAKINTVTVEVCEEGRDDNCDTPDDTTTVHGQIPPLVVVVEKTNDANNDGTFTDDETGRTGDDVAFKATITNNSSVAVVINSISDEWPGAEAITPDCEAAVVGQTLAANGGSVTCDFTVADYVPTAEDGAKINTVTVDVCEEGREDNCDTPDDTTTVRGQIPPLNVTVDKTNDANGDGTFTDDETGEPGQAVDFRVVITNNSTVAVTINDISDEWPGAEAITPECADAVIGETLAANGGSVTCDFTVENYIPAADELENTVTVDVCEEDHDDNCDTPDDKTKVRPGVVLNVTVSKTNDANNDGTYTDDETGTSGADAKFRVTITNNTKVAVVIDSISDTWPGASAITPECATAVIGQTVAANGGTITCDFIVQDYVPTNAEGAKVNTVTVGAHEENNPKNSTSKQDTTTVRGQEVLGAVITPTPSLPRTGSNTMGLLVAALGLLVMGAFLLLGGQLSGAAAGMRLSSSAALVTHPRRPVIDRNAPTGEADAPRASETWSEAAARRWAKHTGR